MLVHRRRRNFKSAESAEKVNNRQTKNHHHSNAEQKPANSRKADKTPHADEQIFGGAAISLIDNGDNDNVQRHNDDLFEILDKLHSTTPSPAKEKLQVSFFWHMSIVVKIFGGHKLISFGAGALQGRIM